MSFDFDSAVSTPFRMQPGLRRMADAATHLMPMAAGSRHQREKLAILSAQPEQALQVVAGFDASPAFHALAAHAAREHPQAFTWDGERACAPVLGVAVHGDHRVEEHASGSFGLGDEIGRCLRGLSPKWRLAGLLSLAFVEDFALVDGATGTLPWLAVALPSHWAPEDKVGRHFREVHAPVADNELLLRAGDHLMRMVCGPERWERFVWNVTAHPHHDQHPRRHGRREWPAGAAALVAAAHWRTEHQSFIPLPEQQQAVFTIHVDVQPLAAAINTTARAAALHAALATMSEAVLGYRGLTAARPALLDWLAARR